MLSPFSPQHLPLYDQSGQNHPSSLTLAPPSDRTCRSSLKTYDAHGSRLRPKRGTERSDISKTRPNPYDVIYGPSYDDKEIGHISGAKEDSRRRDGAQRRRVVCRLGHVACSGERKRY